MLLKPLKKKLKRDGLQGFSETVKYIMQMDCDTDDDRMLVAVLAEIVRMAEKKLLDVRTEYTISLTPAQAIAVRLLATSYMAGERTKYTGNIIHQISDEANKLYA